MVIKFNNIFVSIIFGLVFVFVVVVSIGVIFFDKGNKKILLKKLDFVIKLNIKFF